MTPLTDALDALGVFPISDPQLDNGVWHTVLETETEYKDPEANVTAMLDAIDALDEASRELWGKCSHRDFDIGYECGEEPHFIRDRLSRDAIRRIAQAGAELRITLYGMGVQRAGDAEKNPMP